MVWVNTGFWLAGFLPHSPFLSRLCIIKSPIGHAPTAHLSSSRYQWGGVQGLSGISNRIKLIKKLQCTLLHMQQMCCKLLERMVSYLPTKQKKWFQKRHRHEKGNDRTWEGFWWFFYLKSLTKCSWIKTLLVKNSANSQKTEINCKCGASLQDKMENNAVQGNFQL